MRIAVIFVCLFSAALRMLGQAATGTITGTVMDSTGAVIGAAAVEARNSDTGVVYQAATTATGNYTIAQLPVGTYEITVRVTGFKTYAHPNLAVPAGATIKEDVSLEVGTAAEAVTVTDQASLLSTESVETAHNVTLSQLDNVPLLGIGATNAGTAGIRNPFALTQLLPGTVFGSPTGAGASNTVIVNGLENNSEAVRVEGQDSRNNTPGVTATAVRQPSADAIQEVSVQTSNYAPEFGEAGGAVYNIIMKSGTNGFHGSGYEYFVNEDLNAAGSFSQSSSGGKYLPRNRRNDYGTTLGGPVWIPKVYNGRDKTFFFFSWEQYREDTQLTFNDTVPTVAYQNGDFSAISPNGTCSLCAQYGIQQTALGVPTPVTDPVGQQIYANEIFDPATRAVNPATNLGYASPFPNNIIPASRFNATALAMQKLFPQPSNSNLTQNYIGDVPSLRITTIPSYKFDEIPDRKDKLSFYYSTTGTASAVSTPLGNADGLPLEIGQYRGTYIDTKTIRLNYDRTMTPTLLLHFGIGWQRVRFDDQAPFTSFNPSQFGLTGFEIDRQFPSVTGMCAGGSSPTLPCTGAGGMQYIGTASQTQSVSHFEKPTYNANLTWVRGNHTLKSGGEAVQMGAIMEPFAGVTLATGTGPTSEPFTPTNSLNGYSMGFGYASFLLGDFNSTTQTPLEDYREGHMAWAWFLQDSWKVTRKLTLTYGIRYDVSTPVEEEHGRVGQFDPNLANPNAGGHLGAVEFANTCNCAFYQSTYPWGFGPRLGAAYQLDSKTVFRAGWGFVYQYATDDILPTIGSSAVNSPTGVNPFVNISTPNSILQPVWPVTNPYVYPAPGVALGATGNVPFVPDRNYNRPPRQNQFSAGIQREIMPNLLLEAAYVANRDVWLSTTDCACGTPGFLSQISPAVFAQYGLYPYPGSGPAGYTLAQNYADYQLLLQPINSTAVISRMKAAGAGVNGLVLPYSGFPMTNSLLSALYPYAQYGNLAVSGSPNGRSKYDSLQMKATKRLSHGLQAAGAFAWQKAFTAANRQNFFDPTSSVWDLQQIPPLQLTLNATYVMPRAAFLNNFENLLVKDWQIGWFSVYQSGQFLTPPTNNISNFLSSEEYLVPGQPLYLVNNINNNSQINPYTQQVLNPNAWASVPAGGAGPAIGTLYSDFRGPRRPVENANLGRNFRVKEKYNLQIRAEFTNIFNRTFLPNPITSVAPQVALTKNNLGQYTNGFGVMNVTAAVNTVPTLNGASRAGTLIARFTF
jgi:hypothetical protein